MQALSIEGLRAAYGDVVVLNEIDLEFEFGTVHCLAGPNGAGKSTLLRCLAGLTQPTAGTVQREHITVGYAFQEPSVYPGLSVAENLDVFVSLTGADRSWRDSLVERLRLDTVSTRPASELSGGFAKKLDLALALLKEPDVLLLDEPLADIDEAAKRELLELLADYHQPDRIQIVSTHDLDAFSPRADRLTVLFDGEVVREETTETLAGQPFQSAYTDALDRLL